MNKRSDNPREFLGQVTLSDGRQVDIFMPIMEDVLFPTAGKLPLQLMIEAGTGIAWEDFMKLPVPDGNALMTMLQGAIESFNAYVHGKKH